MNYHHFTIEERCCLREYYVKGKSYREIARLLGRNVSSVSRELNLFQGYTQILPVYGAKKKRLEKQLPPPRDVLETGGVGVHRREAVANMVARTDIQYPVRDEDAVVQDNLPLDRRKIFAFHPEKSAEERENP